MWLLIRILGRSSAAAKQPISVSAPNGGRGRRAPRIAIAVVVLLLAGLLAPVPQSGREIEALFDLLHAPIFAILAALFWELRHNWLPQNRIGRAVVIWWGVSLLGLAVEYAQGLTGRHPSWDDAIANAWGAAAGLLWSGWYRPHAPPSTAHPCPTNTSVNDAANQHKQAQQSIGTIRRLAVWAGVFVLLVVAGWQPLVVLTDAFRQRSEFPRLASFESSGELTRWTANDCRLSRSEAYATHGAWSLRLDLQTGVYPGAALKWPVPDWSDHQELAFDVYVAGHHPLDLVVKIQDQLHNQETSDRYQRPVRLTPGANRVSIALSEVAAAPAGRTLDLRKISMLQFYTVRPARPQTLYLDHIHLR
jgi:VanZ family protein